MYGRPTSTQESVKLRLITVQQRPLSLALSSSSTPTVPYSTADILYGSEVNSKPPIEELRQNSLDLERSKELSRLKSKELEQHPNNRRPNSKSASRKSLSIEAVNIDKEKEDPLKGLSNTLPPTKPSNHFRPNGIRSNILKGEQMFSARSNGALPGRDPDDLVAMGTLWSPNNQNSTQTVATPPQQQMSRNSLPNNISSNTFPSKSNPSSSSVNPSMSASTTVTPQRKYTSNNVRPSVIQNNTISGIKNNLKDKEKEKDVEPKYSDPLIGAPAAYQQRLIELGALEGDTVRWERTKRLKKKKQDRDS